MQKLCQCGCGTPISDASSWARGHNAKRGDAAYLAAMADPNPSGLCQCGCGGVTPVAKQTETRFGSLKGKHRRFMPHHGGKDFIGVARKQWKGGRMVTDQGYVKVRVGDVGDRRYVYEHRLVMERMIGRPLAANEQVHHLDGNKSNNDSSNLELWHRSQPNGIRREDYHCPGCTCST